MGVERQRQDNVQTGDKVEVKQTLIPSSPSPPSPPPPSEKKTHTHKHKQRWMTDTNSCIFVSINLTFRMLVNIHFQMDQK